MMPLVLKLQFLTVAKIDTSVDKEPLMTCSIWW